MNTHLFELIQSNPSKRMLIVKNEFSARTLQEAYNEAMRRTKQNYFQEFTSSKQLSLAVLGHGGSGFIFFFFFPVLISNSNSYKEKRH